MPLLMRFYPGFTPDLIDRLPRREVEELVVVMQQTLAEGGM